MAEKNPNKLYEGIKDLQDNLEAIKNLVEEVDSKIKEVLNDANDFGGVISRVFKEQLAGYFLPGVQKVAEPLDDLISNTDVPGSLKGLTVFLDSVPLAMIRQEPTISELAEPVVPKETELSEPVGSEIDELPVNASYQHPVDNVVSQPEETENNTVEPTEPELGVSEPQRQPQVAPRTVEESVEKKAKDAAYARFVEYKKKKDEEKGFIKKYQVIRTTSVVPALGEAIANIDDDVIFEFDTKDEAVNKADELDKLIYPEEKEMFGTEYKVKEIKVPTASN